MLQLRKMNKNCIICYEGNTLRSSAHHRNKNGEDSGCENKKSRIRHFFQLLERYLDELGEWSRDHSRQLCIPHLEKHELLPSKMNCCKACYEEMESFLELYHQMKSIQLSLNWRLRKITDIMNHAEPSKLKKSRGVKQRPGVGVDVRLNDQIAKRRILDYRMQLLNKCKATLQNTYPKLLLKKCQIDGSTGNGTSEISSESVEEQAWQFKTENCSSDSEMETEAQVPPFFDQDEDNIAVSDYDDAPASPSNGNSDDVESKTTSLHILAPENYNEANSKDNVDMDGPAPRLGNLLRRSRPDRAMKRSTSRNDDENTSDATPMASSDESSDTDSDSDYWNDDDETDDAGSSESSESQQDSGTISFITHVRGGSTNRRAADRRAKLTVSTRRQNKSNASSSLSANCSRDQEKFRATMGLANSRVKCKVPNCSKASKAFCIPSVFQAHQNCHGHFNCSFCGKTYKYAPKLVLHELVEHTKIKFGKAVSKCPRPNCSKIFGSSNKKELLTQHLLSFHMKLIPDTLSHKCPVCKLSLTSKRGISQNLMASITSHYDILHNTDTMDDGATIHKCDQIDCSAYFKSMFHLDTHKFKIHRLRKDHQNQSSGTESIKKPTSSNATKVARVILRKYAKQSASYPEKFQATMGLQNFKCKVPNCPEGLKPLWTPSVFDAHQKYHGHFNCSFCVKIFDYAPDLASHELMEHSNMEVGKKGRASKCPRPNCSRIFRKYMRKESLTQHILSSHLKLIPEMLSHQCPVCKEVLTSRLGITKNLMRSITNHYDICHNTANMEDGATIHNCDQIDCSAYFKTLIHLDTHKFTKHRLRKDGSAVKKPKVKSKNPNSTDKKTSIDRARGILPANVRNSSSYQKKFEAAMGFHNFKCKVLNCPKAGMKFIIPSAFDAHQKYHGNFTCSFCVKAYDYAPDLASHELSDHFNIKFNTEEGGASKCPRPNCTTTFRKCGQKELLIQHILSVHMKLIPETLSHQCPVCKVVLKTNLSINLRAIIHKHYDIHHNTDNMEEGAKIQKCDKIGCPAYFRTLLQLDVHQANIHGLRHTKGRYGCPDCKKNFNDRRLLRTHRINYHLKKDDLVHHCDYAGCNSQFETERELKLHKALGHTRAPKLLIPVRCSTCGKTVRGKGALVTHMKTHEPKDTTSGKTKVVCDICGKECKNNAMLQCHQLSTHFPDKWTFQCSLCPKKCMNQQRLDVHMRMHTQEKPFVCDICGLKYAHKHNLKIHVNSSHKKKGKK